MRREIISLRLATFVAVAALRLDRRHPRVAALLVRTARRLGVPVRINIAGREIG